MSGRGSWRLVEVGERPAGLVVRRNEAGSRTVIELEGVILGWWTDRQQLDGGELVIDWNQIEEAVRLALTKEEG